MAHVKKVVGTLCPLGKTGHSILLPQGMEMLIATSKQLVGVALVAHIPHKGILWALKNTVEGNGQLHNTEITG